MHELSVAQEILKIVDEYLPNPTPNSVKYVKLKVGKFSNILIDSLSFCYEALIDNTPLQGSKLKIIEMPVRIRCTNCNNEFEIETPVFACPVCGHNQLKIISGTEMRVEEIELFDENESIIENNSQLKEKE